MNPTDENESRAPGERAREDDPTPRGAASVNERPGGRDAELHPDSAETMQHDHDDAVGRQRYADARPGDYSRDFQSDGSGAHPVKPVSEEAVDENGIPEVAATEPPAERPADDGKD